MANEEDTSEPDPGASLARIRRDAVTGRGRLRVFFGYASGVGKTYAMLQAAHALADAGHTVALGYLAPQVQPETLALATGLVTIAPLELTKGKASRHLPNFAAILRLKPDIVVLDELLHAKGTNVRHRKRYHYLDELLEAGIDVFTSMNIQQLASLHDIAAGITGITMRETVPDNIFFDADQVDLIDIEPESLLERLRAGIAHRGEESRQTDDGLYSVNDLAALRQLAHRATADRVARRMELERLAKGGSPAGSTSDRILVAVGGSPWSARLVQVAQRLASSIKAPWIALHIVTHEDFSTVENRECVRSVLKLAESLGAETAIVRGEKAASEVLSFARARNITMIVAGQDRRENKLLRLIKPSLADTLLRGQSDIDIFLVRGDAPAMRRVAAAERPMKNARTGIKAVVGTSLIMLLTLSISLLFNRFAIGEANIIMAHLLGAFLTAIAFGQGAGVAASIWSVMQFNFFFTEPRLAFTVYDPRYIPIFAIMLLVALVTASLASRLHRQSDIIKRQETQTYQLYLFGQSLAEASGIDGILKESCRQLSKIYSVESAIFLPDNGGGLNKRAKSEDYRTEIGEETAIDWCFKTGKAAGRGTDTLPATRVRYEPIKNNGDPIGVVGIIERDALNASAGLMHIDTALSLIGRALERERLIEERRQATIQAESERLRSSLLRSVSHDLRTPLSGIAGAAESLGYAKLDRDTIAAIASDIEGEAERLTLLVDNILNLTRLQEDTAKLRKSMESVDDLVYAAAETARKRYRGREIKVELDERPEVVDVDPILIQQLLLNYIDNADKYSPSGAPIELSAKRDNNEVYILVRDHGPGVPPEWTGRIFEKFIRAYPSDGTIRGSGLGLYICESIARAHGGHVFVATADGGGSVFGFTLAVEKTVRGDDDA